MQNKHDLGWMENSGDINTDMNTVSLDISPERNSQNHAQNTERLEILGILFLPLGVGIRQEKRLISKADPR
jgi:hypothetical protein